MREKVTVKKLLGTVTPLFLHYALSYGLIILFLVMMGIVLDMVGKVDLNNVDIRNEVLQVIMNKYGLLIDMGVSICMIPVFIGIKKRDKIKRKIKGLHKKYENVDTIKYLLIVPVGLFVMLSANIFVSLLTAFMPKAMTDTYNATEKIIYDSSFTVQLLAAAIVAPIIEELIFRGIIFNRMKNVFMYPMAIIFSSFIFGVYHGNFVQAPYAFIIGIIACLLYDRYRNITAPILFHMSANFFSLLLTVLVKTASNKDVVENADKIASNFQLSSYLIPMGLFAVFATVVMEFIYKNVNPKEIR